MKKYFCWAASGLVLMLACQSEPSGGHLHEPGGGHSHDEGPSMSHTAWTKQAELFVEFPPLVVGKSARFAAHFTRLVDYKPVREGSLTLSLVVGGKGIRQRVAVPSSPGIFTPNLNPTTAGKGQLIFELNTPDLSERIVLENIQVFASQEEALAGVEEGEAAGDAIDFLKEQAWKIDFQVQPVSWGLLSKVIHSTGEIAPMHGDAQIIAAPSSGLVFFAKQRLTPGRAIKKGEWVFTLVATGDPDENLKSRLAEAQARLKKAESELLRRESLIENKVISQKDYEESELEYKLARVAFENLTQYLEGDGRKVYAPKSGFIKDIYADPGAFVSTGTPVLELTQSRRLQLVADLPPQYYPDLKKIKTAEFKTSYDEQWRSIENYNGRLVSYEQNVDSEDPFIPLYFEVDNTGDLLPGSYVEMLLHVGQGRETLLVPRSALLEDFGNYYVMVQRSGESFEKRAIKTGAENGTGVEVLEGLKAGEMVVTKGAYQVKMASMASSLPAHGHTH